MSIEKAIKNLKKSIEKFTYNVTVDTFERIAIRNPVLTGLSVGNWQVNTNPSGVSFIDRLDPTKTITLTQIKQDVPKTVGSVVYMSNHTPYIGKLEGLEGKEYMSPKAPYGMVGVTFDQMSSIVADAAGKV